MYTTTGAFVDQLSMIPHPGRCVGLDGRAAIERPPKPHTNCDANDNGYVNIPESNSDVSHAMQVYTSRCHGLTVSERERCASHSNLNRHEFEVDFGVMSCGASHHIV